MNWKKLGLFVAGSTAVGAVTPWLQGAASGHAIPFTTGNIVPAALLTLGSTLVALFSNPPHKDGN